MDTSFLCEVCFQVNFKSNEELINHYYDRHSSINFEKEVQNEEIRKILGFTSLIKARVKCSICGQLLEEGIEFNDHKYSHEIDKGSSPVQHTKEFCIDDRLSESTLACILDNPQLLEEVFTKFPSQTAISPENKLNESIEEEDNLDDVDEKLGITKKYLTLLDVKKMDAYSFCKLKEADKNCAICLDDIQVGERYIRLPCMHLFHKKDIFDWFKKSHFCPVCKLNIWKELKQ